MGTNYYVAKDRCTCCKRYDKEHHIGKSSWGWAFTFQGYRLDGLISWKDWKAYLKDKEVVDEYGEFQLYDEFVAMIEGPKAPGWVRADGHKNLSHNTEGKKDGWFNPEYDWDDDLGYSFTRKEFS